ncbi:hypothetical protein B0H16DRAFT_1574994 [Mycena metata]|uniref:F-box domain-containing protein n=1 Tax=Mycena metata TaxID=1033252 RepID=A0AAD7I660_9AGAR|nr:hypothetical protein B0H16DRAFT_1574994 [Mycena metata]
MTDDLQAAHSPSSPLGSSRCHSPAHALPVELTCEIFLHCISVSLISSDAKLSRPLDDPPVLLTKICRKWRLIALAMPSLWSDVQLAFGGKRGCRVDTWWISFLETWFSRAQEQPLGIDISSLNPTDSDSALLELLDNQRHRLRRLAINLPFMAFRNFSAVDPLPILEQLAIGAHNVPREVETPITAFRFAPLLNHVSLGGGLRPGYFVLPWEQLTHLELAAARVEDCLECLRQAPRITICVLEIQDTGSPASIPPLLRLRSITLSGTDPFIILQFVAMPGLEDLDVVARSLNSEDLTRISFFVSRSQCQLRRLRLHYIPNPLTVAALQLLEALPFLETLELSATEANTIMALLRRLDDGETTFLPQLQNLSIAHHKMRDKDMHAMFNVVAMILLRRGSHTPEHVQLRSFSLTMQYEQTPPRLWVRQQLRNLAERGMSIEVRNHHERWV